MFLRPSSRNFIAAQIKEESLYNALGFYNPPDICGVSFVSGGFDDFRVLHLAQPSVCGSGPKSSLERLC